MTENWQERTRLLLGDEAMLKLKRAHVLIVGLGGVGGMAAEMLCRAGIGSLTIADADIVQFTNRNRQIAALLSTEGLYKADVMAARLVDINPELSVYVEKAYLKDDAMVSLLERGYDYVVDAIDTLSPKIYLIVHASRMGLRVVSSMGSGSKTDPSLIRISDISETHTCPFAFDIRKRLRRLGIVNGIKAVFSEEKPMSGSVIPIENEMNKKSVVGNISYIPAAFGCFCASVVIRDLTLLNK